MYEKHPVFEEPAEDALLWRYMSFGKFIAMLQSKSLYFCRVDRFEDSFEGQLPKPTYELTEPRLRAGYLDARVSTIVNCWNMAEHESVALWRTYLPHGEGVAIRSTFGRLRDCFRPNGLFQEARVHIGLVKYINFNEHDYIGPDRTAFNGFMPLVHKRRYYEFEREIRAVISRLGTHFLDGIIRHSPGLNVPVDLLRLIDRVYVAPDAQGWFADAVRASANVFGLSQDIVTQSGLDEPPPGWREQGTA